MWRHVVSGLICGRRKKGDKWFGNHSLLHRPQTQFKGIWAKFNSALHARTWKIKAISLDLRGFITFIVKVAFIFCLPLTGVDCILSKLWTPSQSWSNSNAHQNTTWNKTEVRITPVQHSLPKQINVAKPKPTKINSRASTDLSCQVSHLYFILVHKQAWKPTEIIFIHADLKWQNGVWKNRYKTCHHTAMHWCCHQPKWHEDIHWHPISISAKRDCLHQQASSAPYQYGRAPIFTNNTLFSLFPSLPRVFTVPEGTKAFFNEVFTQGRIN